jgi:acetyltransferase-like isoleucine patch superfamily enzyme
MRKSRIKRLTEDHGNRLIYKFDNIRLMCYNTYSSFFVYFISIIRNIKINGNCQFYGIPHFRRFQFSTISIGKNCTFRSDNTSNLIGINHKCILSTHHETATITIGDNCGFSGTSIGAAKEIRIGNNVLVGANSIITDFDWHLDRSNTTPLPVIIQDNVWIGVNTTILKGVTIGENSIIGANSLVVKNIPANVIAGGVPCKVLKLLEK